LPVPKFSLKNYFHAGSGYALLRTPLLRIPIRMKPDADPESLNRSKIPVKLTQMLRTLFLVSYCLSMLVNKSYQVFFWKLLHTVKSGNSVSEYRYLLRQTFLKLSLAIAPLFLKIMKYCKNQNVLKYFSAFIKQLFSDLRVLKIYSF